MHKHLAYAYFASLLIAILFIAGMLRLEGSAVFSGPDSSPAAITLATERGAIPLMRSSYSYFSFWFGIASYSHSLSAPLALEGTVTIPAHDTAPFAYAIPEAHILAGLELYDARGTGYACAIAQLPGHDATLARTCSPKNGTREDIARDSIRATRITAIFVKPTSIREKLVLFFRSARALIP